MVLARGLIATSAGIALVLGTLHLVYTFTGSKLRPRDPELRARMEAVSPVISGQTTMWKAWIGFNASHSFAILLFGSVYGYLVLFQPTFLFQSKFLGILGGVFLAGYVMLARMYWFNVPLGAVTVALTCYGAGFAVAWA